MGHSDILSPHIWQVPWPHRKIMFLSLSRHTGHIVCSLMSASCCCSFCTSLTACTVPAPASRAPLFMISPPPPPMLLTVCPATGPAGWPCGARAPWPRPGWLAGPCPPCTRPPAAPSGTELTLTTFLSLLAEKQNN